MLVAYVVAPSAASALLLDFRDHSTNVAFFNFCVLLLLALLLLALLLLALLLFRLLLLALFLASCI